MVEIEVPERGIAILLMYVIAGSYHLCPDEDFIYHCRVTTNFLIVGYSLFVVGRAT